MSQEMDRATDYAEATGFNAAGALSDWDSTVSDAHWEEGIQPVSTNGTSSVKEVDGLEDVNEVEVDSWCAFHCCAPT
jgi:hypothetical protein